MEKGQFEFEVNEEANGKRLDKFLAGRLKEDYSRSFLQKLVSEGRVLVNGSTIKPHHKLRQGDKIDVNVPAAVPSLILPEDIPLDIIYEDEDLLIVNKPSGMVVHPAPSNYSGTLVNALLYHCKGLSSIGGVLKPGIVHRLDKGTSGLLVVAKKDSSHVKLAGQFKAKTITRRYIALVKGVVQLDNGIIELPIGRSTSDRKRMAVNFSKSKAAITRYKVLERFKNSTLLEIAPGTGRTHQIRVHMSYIGHILIGDEKYGYKGDFKRPALHAKTLGFIHPSTGKYMEFTSDLLEDMKGLIERLKGL